LPFGEPEPKEDTNVSAFLADIKFKQLPSRYQKAIAQAVTLFHFLKKKEDVSFAPIFTPLLGPLDEAARGMILRNMQDVVPAKRDKQYEFFHPDLSELPTGEANFHQRQAKNLERTLVDKNGLMPIGLLRWILDYSKSTRRKISGVFEAVRIQLADVSQTDLVSVLDSIYNFRNEYIAHQDRELSDIELAGRSLKEWANGLYKIWTCR
ncbi:restriction endonuclease subunit R, partial [Thermodesulfobacteriota bacterium]